MMRSLEKTLRILYLVIPASLCVVSLYLFTRYGFNMYRITGPIWKSFWHPAFYFFLVSAVIELSFFLQHPSLTLRSFVSRYRTWALGFFLSMFSFALTGFILDLGTVLTLLLFR